MNSWRTDWTQFGEARVLVTGGLGFIGSNVVLKLAQCGARVTVLDDGFTGKPENLAGTAGYQLINGSVANAELVNQLVRQSEYVFHLACRNIIVSTKDPAADVQVNAVGTANVLLAARDTGVKRIVYASTASVYGNPRLLPASETDAVSLLSPYSASKYAGECFCQAYRESFGIPVAILRYSNVYGPNQRPDNPYCGVVSRFMDAAMDGMPLTIIGDGEQTRDFTYVEDVVDATLLSALSPQADGEVFNVATGIETSVNRLAALVRRASGLECRTQYAPRRDIDTVRRRVLSPEQIRRRMRWTPRVGLEEGLALTWSWMQNQRSTKTLAPPNL